MLLIGQIIPITSTEPLDISAYGEATIYPSEGEYEVFLGADNTLDKRIIVVDGFDTNDSRDINDIYHLLDYSRTFGTQNLTDLLRTEGFDVVILNFPVYTRAADAATIAEGTDLIEGNVMTLVELVKHIYKISH